ncbi:MAG: DNA polymerase III subunit alpha, partial [Brevinema sp.]
MSKYIPLHVQSHYSILQAVPTIDELVEQAKTFGLSSFALTDRNNMFGVPEFGKAMKKAGMKPIFGLKVDVTEGSRFSSTRQTKEQALLNPPNTLVFLAQTDEGYRNLLKLVSAGYKDASFGRFKVDKNLIEEYNSGVLMLSSDDTGLIRQLAGNKNIERLDEELSYYRELFGKDRFFLELHDGGSTSDKIINKLLLEKAAEFDLNYVASNTVRVLKPHQRILCDIVCAIRESDTISKMTARSDYDSLLPNGDLEQTHYLTHEYFKSPQEMEEQFSELPLALENTLKIAEMCEDIAFQAKGDQSPQFPVPQGHNAETFLREQAFHALESKFPQGVPQTYTDRLQYELDIVCKMGFPNYFLVVGDFVGFARKNGIFVGPGRGSAAGALLSYVLGITNIDPLPYDLLFERFLNPERISMPDIDSDFEDERRDEVKEYLRSTYGMDKTADVITFGYNKAKAVLKDVGRVLEIPLAEVNRVSGLIGRQEVDEDLADTLQTNEALQEAAKKDRQAKLWIEFAALLCGRIRNLGKHASAIIVAGRPIEQIVPLTRDKNNTVTTQFEGGYLEENGLLKMDVLGLANLGIIRDCLLRIRKERGEAIDIDTIPQDDTGVFKLFTDGRTAGIFQFESEGMTAYLRQLRPSNIEDLIAMNALYRPGPMDNIPSFIKRKNGEEPIDCFHPSLEPILKPTYGIIVYQEQVMQIAQVLSGFSLGEADNVRRIMAKKKPEELEKIHKPWIEGAVKQGYPEELAQTLFDLLIPFSNYAFNKSHAASYSV